jgi:hypothetical protein
LFASNGIARAKINDKWGYINRTGAWAIQPKYNYAYSFDEDGIAEVEANGVWSYIDSSGRLYSTKDGALAAKYSVKMGEDYTNYMNRVMPTWDNFLKSSNVVEPKALSEESIKQTIENEMSNWQQKGEFESTAKWQERVNETTRNALIEEIESRIRSEYAGEVAEYHKKLSDVESEYAEKQKIASDKFCQSKEQEFLSQNFDLKPYDADNEAFLISTTNNGDIKLNVPVDEAPQFKANWENIKRSVRAKFVILDNNAVLDSVTFGNYTCKYGAIND